MNIEKHIKNLKQYIKDDEIIENDNSDFAQFCKSHCEDIQAVLEDKNNQELKKLENVLKSFNNNRSTLQDKQENNQCFDCDSRML